MPLKRWIQPWPAVGAYAVVRFDVRPQGRVQLGASEAVAAPLAVEAGSLVQVGPMPTIDPADMAAQRLMLGVAETIATQFEKFAGWLITGFAAVVALLVANYDKVAKSISLGSVKLVIWLFFAAAIAHGLQRLLVVFVQNGGAGAKEGEKVGASGLDWAGIGRMFEAVAKSYLWPMSALIRASMRKAMRGDILFMARIVVNIAVFTATLAGLQLLLTLWAVAAIALAINVPATP